MTKKRTINEYRQTKEFKTPVPNIETCLAPNTMMPSAEDYLDSCDYITIDSETVNLDEGLIHETMEAYAGHCVKTELVRLLTQTFSYKMGNGQWATPHKYIEEMIKDLEQDC
jgi:hypothetical protein